MTSGYLKDICNYFLNICNLLITQSFYCQSCPGAGEIHGMGTYKMGLGSPFKGASLRHAELC